MLNSYLNWVLKRTAFLPLKAISMGSYGDIDEDFYDALGDVYHDAVVIASNDERIYAILKDRLSSVLVEFAGFGWGMEDYISGEYYSIAWIGDERWKVKNKLQII